jgi:hypothetical protein
MIAQTVDARGQQARSTVLETALEVHAGLCLARLSICDVVVRERAKIGPPPLSSHLRRDTFYRFHPQP